MSRVGREPLLEIRNFKNGDSQSLVHPPQTRGDTRSPTKATRNGLCVLGIPALSGSSREVAMRLRGLLLVRNSGGARVFRSRRRTTDAVRLTPRQRVRLRTSAGDCAGNVGSAGT